jgi:REP element-mobilizing transposase RayT
MTQLPDPDGPGRPTWYSRGYLPHHDGLCAIQHITFHLADSLPAETLARLDRACADVPHDQRDAERRRRIDAWIDAGHGHCPFTDPSLAAMMQNALLHGDGTRYRLFAWVVMPNHVHVLCQPQPNWSLARIVGSWKSYSGRRLHAAGTPLVDGRIWHREYWDRYIRDERHFLATREYIHRNPVAARLVAEPSAWRWSSAWASRPGESSPPLGTPGSSLAGRDESTVPQRH